MKSEDRDREMKRTKRDETYEKKRKKNDGKETQIREKRDTRRNRDETYEKKRKKQTRKRKNTQIKQNRRKKKKHKQNKTERKREREPTPERRPTPFPAANEATKREECSEERPDGGTLQHRLSHAAAPHAADVSHKPECRLRASGEVSKSGKSAPSELGQ